MVRAIDRQETILQSNITERIQQTQQQHPDIQQRYFETQLRQEHKKKLQRILESEEKEPVHFREEGKKRHEEQQRRDQNPRAASPDESFSDHDEEHGHIDIKV